MLKQATIAQLRKKELPRGNSLLVVAMRRYPRGLKKELMDEYRSMLAPDVHLFADWRNSCDTYGHGLAFEKSNYEARFRLSEEALKLLKCYADLSHDQDIYLICQCDIGYECHRELLLQIAKKNFGAKTDEVYNEYPIFTERLARGDILSAR